MKTKKSRLKSFFAMLLVVSMVCQQSSLTVLATEDTYEADGETVAQEVPVVQETTGEIQQQNEQAAEGTAAEEQSEPVVQDQTESENVEGLEQVTEASTDQPTVEITDVPSDQPTAEAEVTEAPSEEPTAEVTEAPSEKPAAEVTEAPSEEPAAEVTDIPQVEPTAEVTEVPTEKPTAEVTEMPAEKPTADPTVTPDEPTEAPAPSAEATPIPEITIEPTETPALTPKITEAPTEEQAEVIGSVTQEVLNREVDGNMAAVIKFKIKVENCSVDKDAVTDIKAILPETLTFLTDNETTEDYIVENGTIAWKKQEISAYEVKEYVFFALVNENVTDTKNLIVKFYIDDEKIPDNKVSWANTELLNIAKVEEAPTLLSSVCSGVEVTVTADEGVLEPGTTLNVKKVSTIKATEAVEDILAENQSVEELVAFDVTLVKDGEEVQPNGQVNLSFANISFVDQAEDEDKELVIAHVADSMTDAEDMGEIIVSDDSVAVDTTHFSVYAVALVKASDETEYKTITEKYESQNGFNYNDGNNSYSSIAFDFHIFAKESIITNHTNGNIAANKFNGGGHGIGTNQNREDKVLEYNYFGESANEVGTIASGITVIGKNISTSKENNGKELTIGNGTKQEESVSKNIYKEAQESDAFIDIDSELENLKLISKDMAQNGTSSEIKTDFPADTNNKIVVDLSNSQNQINYLNVTAEQLRRNGNKSIILFKGLSGKTLIVNVDMTGADPAALENIVSEIEGFSNGETVVRSECNLLWNFYERKNGQIQSYTTSEDQYAKIGTSDYFMGTILAPGANVKYGALNGSVIAQKTESSGKESHNWRYSGLSATITVNKSFDVRNASAQTFYFAIFLDQGVTRVTDQAVKSVTLSGGQSGTVKFSNLKSGVTYYVYETDVNGNPVGDNFSYTIVGGNGKVIIPEQGNNDISISNTTKQIQTSIEITANKKLKGGVLQANQFRFTLTQIDDNGNPCGTPVTATNDANGYIAFPAITYTTVGAYNYVIEEITGTDDKYEYDTSSYNVEVRVSDDGNGGLTVSKTITKNGTKVAVAEFINKCIKVDIEGSKTWSDNNNKYITRPGEITIRVKNGTTEVASTTVTAANDWSYEFKGLPKYDRDGNEIQYSIEEDAVTGYDSSVTGYDVENTLQTIDISGSKEWNDAGNEGARPTKITVRLLADGQEVDHAEVSKSNGWSWSFSGKPKYAAGNEIKYSVVEDSVENYTTEKGTGEYDIKNTYNPGKTSIHVTKAWNDARNQDGKRPLSVEVELYADGKATGKTATLNESNGWSYTWSDLDEKSNGRTITYSVKENDVNAAYTVTYGDDGKGNFTVTNTHTPETVDISGSKEWNDAGNEGARPTKITVRLLADGQEVDHAEVSKSNGWSWSFSGKPKYAAGNEIKYSVVEDSVENYTTEKGTGEYDIKNTYNPGKTSIHVTKAWNDARNQDGKRPLSVEVELYADGKATGKTATLNESNGWSYTWSDLDEKSNGRTITYSVKENDVNAAYTVTYGDNGKGNFTVTNTHTPETIDIDGSKTWNDNGDESNRPSSIIINLLANGTVVDTKEVTATDNWTWKFEGKPKYESGKEIKYTVSEVSVAGFISSKGDGDYDIVNTPTKVTINKVEARNNENLSGAALQIQDADGNVVEEWVTDGTPHVIIGKLAIGKTYTLVETIAPKGYAVADPVTFTVEEDATKTEITLVDVYSAKGSLSLTATKRLTTTETALLPDQFTFVLCDKDGNILQTKKNDADGNVTFDEIPYVLKAEIDENGSYVYTDETGSYEYTVKEVNDGKAGYTYDDIIYTVNVEVTDAGDGNLTVTPKYHSSKAASADETVEAMTFNNIYTASGEIVLDATKSLIGQNLEEKQFTFEAKQVNEKGEAVTDGYKETANNDAGGKVIFPIIKYEKSGTYFYQITEVNDQKPGYEYDESIYLITVEVKDDDAGNLTAAIKSVKKNGEEVPEGENIVFHNTYTASAELELTAKKSMKMEGTELGTFEFELKDAAGNVIETVQNDGTGTITFSKLPYDQTAIGQTFTYTVNEKIPTAEEQAGTEGTKYVYDHTIYTVTVNVEDNKDGTLKLNKTITADGVEYAEEAMKFVNDTTKVTISKIDDASEKALEGATLQVTDADGNVIEEWVSDGTPHVITGKLIVGKTYTLVETIAPEHYEIADPIEFTVEEDDTKNEVVMRDVMTKSKKAAIKITKELKLNDELMTAVDKTFYVALFADQECTKMVSEIKALEFKDASSATVEFKGLDLGRTYYVKEVDKDGQVIEVGTTEDGTAFVPFFPEGNEATITEDGEKTTLTFENQFTDWPDGFYLEAKLTITKQLLKANGKAQKSDKVFYAGVFEDEDLTTLTTKLEKPVVKLDLAGNSQASETVKMVLEEGESFKLYIAETDKNGTPVDNLEKFAYDYTIENGNVSFDKDNTVEKVTIINQPRPKVTPTVTPTVTPEATPTETPSVTPTDTPQSTPTVTPEGNATPTPVPTTSTGVKTGDDTPIGFYLLLLLAAAITVEETVRRRRKKEQD